MACPLSRRLWGGTRDKAKNVCVGGYVRPSLPALSTSRLVLFCMCSHLDDTWTMSYAKSKSSRILVNFHLISFLCLSFCSSHCSVNSKQEQSDITHPCLMPVVILNHFDCSPSSSTDTLKIILHHSYQLA